MISNKHHYELYPLFSKCVYVSEINLDFKKILNRIKKHNFKLSGTKTKTDVSNISSVSSSKNILDSKEWNDLKKEILKQLNFYTSDVLQYKNKFKMTTSWFTKTAYKENSNYHNHKNSMISSVLYIQCDEKAGDINFHDFKNDDLFHLEVKEYNIYNSIGFGFKPKPGRILFFPSQLYHKILSNESTNDRYSVACNFIPFGDINSKTSDSFLNIK